MGPPAQKGAFPVQRSLLSEEAERFRQISIAQLRTVIAPTSPSACFGNRWDGLAGERSSSGSEACTARRRMAVGLARCLLNV